MLKPYAVVAFLIGLYPYCGAKGQADGYLDIKFGMSQPQAEGIISRVCSQPIMRLDYHSIFSAFRSSNAERSTVGKECYSETVKAIELNFDRSGSLFEIILRLGSCSRETIFTLTRKYGNSTIAAGGLWFQNFSIRYSCYEGDIFNAGERVTYLSPEAAERARREYGPRKPQL